MSNITYAHSFCIGLLLAAVLSNYMILAAALSILTITIWGNFIIPILLALLIDTSLVAERGIHNLYGFSITIVTILLTVTLLQLRKLLKF